MDLDESDGLCTLQAGLERELFDCGLEIKKLLFHCITLQIPSLVRLNAKG